MAATLYERALIAARDADAMRLDDILQRMAVYDSNGEFLARWNRPAQLSIDSDPPGASVVLARYEDDDKGRRTLSKGNDLGFTPIAASEVRPGSYLLTLRKAGYADVHYPVQLRRGEQLGVKVPILADSEIPPGMVYIPPGRFLFGVLGQEAQRKYFFNHVPAHDVTLPAYFIGRYETTYGEYIEYLKTLPADKLADFLPKVGQGGTSGTMELQPVAGASGGCSCSPVP